MQTTRRHLTLMAVAALLTVACGDGKSGAVSTESAPFHAAPAEATVVSGTAACEFSDDGIGAGDEPGEFLVVCELDLSDPRVSGTERHDRFAFVAEGGDGAVWLVEDATITTAEGAWRGSVQAAEDEAAIPSGEAHYVGEDAYEGLEFHYYFSADPNPAQAALRGWISPISEPPVE